MGGLFLVFVVIIIAVIINRRNYNNQTQSKDNDANKSYKPATLPRDIEYGRVTNEIKSNEPSRLPAVYNGYFLKYGYNGVPIVGIKYREDQSFLTDDLYGSEIELIHELDNEYDDKAVLASCGGVKMGYLMRDSQIRDMAYDWINKKLPMYAAVDNVNVEEKRVSATLGFYDVPAGHETIYNK